MGRMCDQGCVFELCTIQCVLLKKTMGNFWYRSVRPCSVDTIRSCSSVEQLTTILMTEQISSPEIATAWLDQYESVHIP